MIITNYISEISRYPNLTREEEYYLAQKAKLGDKESKHTLIKSNLRFVVYLAKKYHHPKYNNLIDLIQEGNIGLINSIDRYIPQSGNRLITYAAYHIKEHIITYLKDNRFPIETTTEEKRLIPKLNQFRQQYTQEKGTIPSLEEITSWLNQYAQKRYDSTDALSLLELSQQSLIYLDTPLNDKKTESWHDRIPHSTLTSLDHLEQHNYQSIIEKTIDALEIEDNIKYILLAHLFH